MNYAVLLYFDRETENSIWNLHDALFKNDDIPALDRSRHRPHISLAGFSNIDPDKLVSLVQAYANDVEPFDVRLSAIGTFPTEDNVLYLSPVPTVQLLACHEEFHRRLVRSELESYPYYAPARWIPHCTVEMNLSERQFSEAMELCKQIYSPIAGQFREIGAVEYPPYAQLETWPLTKKRI